VSLVTVPKMGLTREIRNFEHLYRHKLRPNYGTWHDTSRLWVLGRTREASPGSYATVVEHTSAASTTAAESALFDSFEFMGEHHKDRLFLSRQALKWIPRLHYTGRRGSQDSTNASNCDITDIWTKREIGNFEHLSRHNPRSDCGTWRNIPRIWVHGGTRKVFRGGLGSRVERNTVRKVDQNGRNGQRRDSNTRRPWPRRAMIGWLQPTKTTLTTSVPIMGFINGDLLRYIFDTWAEKALFDDSGLTGDHQR